MNEHYTDALSLALEHTSPARTWRPADGQNRLAANNFQWDMYCGRQSRYIPKLPGESTTSPTDPITGQPRPSSSSRRRARSFLATLIERIKEGKAIDGDTDGKISVTEIRDWVRARGREFKDPNFLYRLLKSIE